MKSAVAGATTIAVGLTRQLDVIEGAARIE